MATSDAVIGAFDSEVTIRRIRYASEDGGWAVLEAISEDGDEVVLVGPLGHLEQRERAQVQGEWVDDARYGPQVKAIQAPPLAPTDAESVAIYLMRVKHVGAKRAARLIDRYGAAGAIDAIDSDPATALTAAGLRGDAVNEAAASWERLRATRRLHLLLAPHGLAYLVGRIHDTYGQESHRVVTTRPYELTSVFGVG